MSNEKKTSQKVIENKSNLFKKIFWFSFLFLSIAYAWYSFYTPSNKINWIEDITSIEELKSNPSNKNILLFFTAKWCSPCQIMKREVFADVEVENIMNSKVQSIRIDVDNPKTKELVKYYNVGTTPITIIVNSKGIVLDYAVGKIDKKQFLEMLNEAGKQ